MRIGLICPYNMYNGGGVQECVRALQNELEIRGHYVKIISPAPRKRQTSTIDDVIFVGTSTDIRSPFHTTSQVSVSLRAEALEQVLKDENFDVLHFHEPWVPIISRQILAKSNCANVATFHAKLPDTMMSKTIEKVITPYTRSILKDLGTLTAVSMAAQEYVTSLTDESINIVPNGIDLRLYKPGPEKERAKYILYVGRLEKRKGVKYLIDAFKELKQILPEYKLVLAGDGKDREKLESYVEIIGLEDVVFRGYVSEKDKIKLLSQAAVFCSPALYGESFGIVLLEALAMGVPTVAGNNPGYLAVLREKGSLGLVNPRDTGHFASLLSEFCQDDQLRKSWQKWAHEYVKQYDYKVITDKYEELYNVAVKRAKV